MNLSYFIASRISGGNEKNFSSTVHKIAVASISLGLAVMIVSFLILKGFQDTVTNRIYSFSSHLQVTKYTQDNSFEEQPMMLQTPLFSNTEEFPYIDHVQEYSHKPGLIKKDDEVTGVVLKGVSSRFSMERFGDNMISGRFVDFSDSTYSKEIVISQTLADKMDVHINDDVIIHFFQNPPRYRKLTVVGLYETNLAEYFDDKFIIGDIRLIQRLNGWADSVAGGLEVFVKDTDKIREAELLLDEAVPFDLYVEKVSDKYIQVFDWLHLISRQVNIFLGIILFVVCVNMVSIILILIMERTQMIGLLKAMGGTSGLIQGIFRYNGLRLVAKGLLIGNAIGLSVCAIQYFFQIMKLNPADYYMSYVPIGWNWEIVLGLNLLTFVVVAVIITIPTLLIVRISPIRSIRFD